MFIMVFVNAKDLYYIVNCELNYTIEDIDKGNINSNKKEHSWCWVCVTYSNVVINTKITLRFMIYSHIRCRSIFFLSFAFSNFVSTTDASGRVQDDNHPFRFLLNSREVQ